MKITDEIRKTVTQAIVDSLSSMKEATRNEVIQGALRCYGFSEREINAAKTPDSKVNTIRSFIGTTLTELTASGEVSINQAKKYFLVREELVVIEAEACRAEIYRLLKKKPRKKADIYLALQQKFETDKTESLKDDNTLKQIAGQILKTECTAGKIKEETGVFSVPTQHSKSEYPSVPLPEEQFQPLFLARLNELGGAFFERFVANMLEKYFLITGRDVLTCEVVGGSNDGGVDIIIDTEEELGFVEKIMIQAKDRRNIQVTEKEIREFYGVLNAQRGSRGIFVTTATFHPAAEKLLLSIPNCVGIDGKKLFTLVKQTVYGIHKTKSGYTFDNAIFSC